MAGLEHLEKEIYYTYHDKKNKDILPIMIFFSAIFFIFKAAIILEAVLWGWYYYYCSVNNNKLNNDKSNLEKRNRLINLRNKILSGELQFKK